LVRAVAKRLGFRQPARTPPVTLAFFDLDGNRLPSADLCHFAHKSPISTRCRLFSCRLSPLDASRAQQGASSFLALLPQIEEMRYRGQRRNEHKVEQCVAPGAIVQRIVETTNRWGDGITRKRAARREARVDTNSKGIGAMVAGEYVHRDAQIRSRPRRPTVLPQAFFGSAPRPCAESRPYRDR
jgi:hypothetical protein